MAIVQLTQRASLRDTIIRLMYSEKLYHLGIAGGKLLSALVKANEFHHWRMHTDFAQRLIGIARPLNSVDDFELQLTETVYALDSTARLFLYSTSHAPKPPHQTMGNMENADGNP